MLPNSTPVPNALFDVCLKDLHCTELKVLLVVVRQTLGWSDGRTAKGRKQKDWIAGSQLRTKTGCSRRAISSATEALVRKGLLEVLDERNELLASPTLRKGKLRLYYRLSALIVPPGDNAGKTGAPAEEYIPTNAFIAEHLRTNVAALAQTMRTTKETLPN